MNERFQKDADLLLSDLSWNRTDTRTVLSLLNGKCPKRIAKLRLGFVVAMLFMLIAAVALAIGLSQSPRYTAMQAARRALMDQYDLNLEMVRLFDTKMDAEDDRTIIEFSTGGSTFIRPDAVGEYTVEVDKQGNATATWSHDGVDTAVWQDGDLSAPVWGAPQLEQVLARYAVYRQWGKDLENIHELPLNEQEKLFGALQEAMEPLQLSEGPKAPTTKLEGTSEDEVVPATPGMEESAANAVAAAHQALNARYGLTEDMLTLFTSLPTSETLNGKDIWTVAFQPVCFKNMGIADWRWLDTLAKKLGSYEVELSVDNGETLKVRWSLDNLEDDSAYTRSDWAQAKAYGARILPWVLELLQSNESIIAKYPDDQTEWFSVEDAAAYDQAFRDAGFDASRYNHGSPKENDLTAEQALELAKQAMSAEYGLTNVQMAAYELTVEYLLDNGGTWSIGFHSADDMGSVSLRASDGEIQMVTLDSGVGGNG